MTGGPSSTPRGERHPAPGVTWNTTLVRTEQLVDDTAPDPAELDVRNTRPAPAPPNRDTRRALARAARRKK